MAGWKTFEPSAGAGAIESSQVPRKKVVVVCKFWGNLMAIFLGGYGDSTGERCVVRA
jgi:hypothetical protein